MSERLRPRRGDLLAVKGRGSTADDDGDTGLSDENCEWRIIIVADWIQSVGDEREKNSL